MRRIFSWIFNGTVLVLLGLIALALLIWFGGDAISIGGWVPLESPAVRAGLIVVVFVIWLTVRITGWLRNRRANAALLKELSKDSPPGAPAAADRGLGAEEVAELRKRFDHAIATLKTSRIAGQSGFFARFTRRYVYQMPWYMIIGAPGSGKTTALVNSGIEFPLAKEFGKSAIRGVGGTRNCDWWFTNDAVLLDTAGRYTTQESNEALDHAEWQGFLALLRKFRPRAPINGVLLTISVPDLLASDPLERERHAAALRRRLAELDQALRVRFPLYVLVTKVDLLAGFQEYFAKLSNEERAQVWGFTVPLAASDSTRNDVGSAFRGEFGLLQKRIEEALPDVLQVEPDVQRRGLTYAFSQELAGLREALDRFLNTLFSESKFTTPPLVRGVYLTSGTQEGAPLDRVLGAIQRTFGVSAQVQSATAAQGTGRSYFLRNLLQKVIFAESHVVERNPAKEKRRRIAQAVGVAVCTVLLIGALAAWSYSYVNNRNYLADVTPRAAELASKVQAAPNTTSDDLATLLPILDEAHTLPQSSSFDVASPPVTYQFGLYQGRKVVVLADGAYERLLEDLLLPRVALRLERLLREAPPDSLEALYGRLKAYLMLHDATNYRQSYLLPAVTAEWQASEAGNLNKESQQSLAAHLQRLFGERVRQSPYPMDQALVADARQRLTQFTAARRLYAQIKLVAAEKTNGPDFTLVGAIGPESKNVFVRASNKSLDNGIPALYTREGYRAMQAVLNDRRLLLTLDESWVLGTQEQRGTAGKIADALDDRLVNEIRRIYLEEYRQTWEQFLAELRLAPTGNLTASINLVRVLSAPDSPLVKLVKAVALETQLTETGRTTGAVSAQAAEIVKQGANNAVSRIFGSMAPRIGTGGDDPTRAGRIEKTLVDDYFDAWRVMAGSPKEGGSVEQLRLLLNELYSTLVATEQATRTGMPPPPVDTSAKVRAEAARLPVPLRPMLEGLAGSSSAQTTAAARSNVSAQMDAEVGDFCRKAIAGRYPFVRSSTRDVTPDDFAKLFAPGGQLESFFSKNLQQYVDTSTRPWTYRRTIDGAPPGTSASIINFQRAQVIRDAFFGTGASRPQFRLDVKVLEMDPSITTFALDVDGTTVSYVYGPQTWRSIPWPGPAGRSQVSVQLSPQLSGGSRISFEGPWALHRLFDKAQITPGAAPEKFTATLNLDGRRVVLDITAASVRNPIRLPELELFSCPSRL